MKHQVALNAYELDVFSIAGLGAAPQPKPIFFFENEKTKNQKSRICKKQNLLKGKVT